MRSDRRAFLATTTTAILAATAVRSPSLAADKPLPAIDVHTHFYDPSRPEGVPWPNPKDKVLYRTVLPKDFRKTVAGLNVGGTIAVEASPRLEDNQWLLDLAANDSIIVGVVGRLDVDDADFANHLARFAKNPRFRGIRISHADVKKALVDRTVLDRIRLLGASGLSLDVNGGPDLPADVARLASRLTTLRIVINHAGNVKIDGMPPPKDWREGMSAAAEFKNVYCKVSALVEATRRTNGDAPADVAFYRPELDALWELFGEDRLLYASNWPVSDRAAPYSRVIGIVRDNLKNAPRTKSEKFFTRNAIIAYDLPQRPAPNPQ